MIRYLLAALLLLPSLVRADFQEGVQLYASGKYTESMAEFQKAAEAGEPKAIFFIGFYHHNGFGVPKSDLEAIKWFRRSAAMNHHESQWYMGKLSEGAKGIEKDLAAAHMWYTLAAKSAPNDRDAAYSMRDARRIEKKMTPAQIAQAKEMAEKWTPAN